MRIINKKSSYARLEPTAARVLQKNIKDIQVKIPKKLASLIILTGKISRSNNPFNNGSVVLWLQKMFGLGPQVGPRANWRNLARITNIL